MMSDRGIFVCHNASCGIRFAFPQPSDDVLGIYYGQCYYGDAPVYENSSRAYMSHVLDLLERELGPVSGRTVLDYGAGIGTMSRLLVDRGAAVRAVETDATARSSLAAAGVLAARSLDELPDGGNTFDLVLMIEVIEHVRDPVGTMREVQQALRPGGWCYLSTPNALSLRARLQRVEWDNFRNPTHMYYFSETSLRRTLALAGFGQTAVWRPGVVYPEMGRPARLFQTVLQRLRLDGSLRFLAQRSS
jgi:SAM-dependent methyltransferase